MRCFKDSLLLKYLGNNAPQKIFSLGEEVVALKLQTLQDRRQIVMLREEKRRLDTIISSHEVVLATADRARVEAETRLLLNTPEIADKSEPAIKQKSKLAPTEAHEPVPFDARQSLCHEITKCTRALKHNRF